MKLFVLFIAFNEHRLLSLVSHYRANIFKSLRTGRLDLSIVEGVQFFSMLYITVQQRLDYFRKIGFGNGSRFIELNEVFIVGIEGMEGLKASCNRSDYPAKLRNALSHSFYIIGENTFDSLDDDVEYEKRPLNLLGDEIFIWNRTNDGKRDFSILSKTSDFLTSLINMHLALIHKIEKLAPNIEF